VCFNASAPNGTCDMIQSHLGVSRYEVVIHPCEFESSNRLSLEQKKVGFPSGSNRECKGQTLKQEAGLYHSAIGAPNMHSQNSMQDPQIVNFGAKIREFNICVSNMTCACVATPRSHLGVAINMLQNAQAPTSYDIRYRRIIFSQVTLLSRTTSDLFGG
ncbi:hypothetical protein PROFUN_00769, partial [Planoprotostelium fungivorum]